MGESLLFSLYSLSLALLVLWRFFLGYFPLPFFPFHLSKASLFQDPGLELGSGLSDKSGTFLSPLESGVLDSYAVALLASLRWENAGLAALLLLGWVDGL